MVLELSHIFLDRLVTRFGIQQSYSSSRISTVTVGRTKHCHPTRRKGKQQCRLTPLNQERATSPMCVLVPMYDGAKVVKSSSVSTCEETGCTVIDPKTLSGYLKTVETITKIYSMENHRNAAKRE